MPQFELPLEVRRDLCGAGFHDVDAALRAAAVELDLWFLGERLHWDVRSDGPFRHYTNFLAWTDTTAVGIDRGVKRTGDQSLMARWEALRHEPIRKQFRKLRNQALKDRHNVIPWLTLAHGEIVMFSQSLDGSWPGEVIGESTDYLWWLRETALALLLEAITLGARGDTVVDQDPPLFDQMAFPHADPWTTMWDPELRRLLRLDPPPDA